MSTTNSDQAINLHAATQMAQITPKVFTVAEKFTRSTDAPIYLIDMLDLSFEEMDTLTWYYETDFRSMAGNKYLKIRNYTDQIKPEYKDLAPFTYLNGGEFFVEVHLKFPADDILLKFIFNIFQDESILLDFRVSTSRTDPIYYHDRYVIASKENIGHQIREITKLCTNHIAGILKYPDVFMHLVEKQQTDFFIQE